MNFKEFYYKHNASEMHLLDFRISPLKNAKQALCLVGQVTGGDSMYPSAQAWPGPHMLATIKQAEKKIYCLLFYTCYKESVFRRKKKINTQAMFYSFCLVSEVFVYR